MNSFIAKSKLFFKRNGSTILACTAAVGTVTTAVLAVKATPKALKALELAEEEKGEELTKVEIVKTAAPAYIPATITGVATLVCIFGIDMLSKRKQASMASAYALLDRSYKEYKNKVAELYGEAANIRVREEIAKDHYDDEYEVEGGKQLFFDHFSMQYFESTMEEVIHAEYTLNRNLAIGGYVCLNEWYDILGIPDLAGGDELGWYSGQMADMYWHSWLEFHHEKVTMEDGLECYIITFTDPTCDYLDY